LARVPVTKAGESAPTAAREVAASKASRTAPYLRRALSEEAAAAAT
jgi:hypothetical protein